MIAANQAPLQRPGQKPLSDTGPPHGHPFYSVIVTFIVIVIIILLYY